MGSIIELEVDGERYYNWTSMSYETSMDSLSSSVSIEAADPNGILSNLTTNTHCKVYTSNGSYNDLILDGYITKMSRRIGATAHSVTLEISDKLVDLVDCSTVRSNRTWTSSKLKSIVTDLVSPFGITVSMAPMIPNPTIDRLTIQAGESVFDTLDRLCRSQAIMLMGNRQGNVVLGYSASLFDRAYTPLVLGENLKSLDENIDYSDRYSEYIGLSQVSGQGKSWTRQMLHGKATTTDAGITRYRPLMFTSEKSLTKSKLPARVSWEAQIRAGRSWNYTVTLPSWYQMSAIGEPLGLWETNKRVMLIANSIGLAREVLITDISMSLDGNGEVTTLTLRHPDIYKQDPTEEVEL